MGPLLFHENIIFYLETLAIIGLTQGSKVDLGGLSSGTYVLRVSSLDNKISHQFKMVKL